MPLCVGPALDLYKAEARRRARQIRRVKHVGNLINVSEAVIREWMARRTKSAHLC